MISILVIFGALLILALGITLSGFSGEPEAEPMEIPADEEAAVLTQDSAEDE